jgi:hypothetical protein
LESAYVRKLYSRISWDRPLCAAELHRLLQAMLCRLSETWIYFVIDAVDECDHTVSHLLCDLQRLAKANGKYRVFLTSKPQDSIKTILQEFESESVDLDQEIEEDKALFLSHKLETHGLLDFKEPLLATPNTTMLQLELMIYLLSLIQPEERRALEISALSDYDDLYTRIFARVRAPHSWLKEALFCIAFSERPLTVQELSTALGINTLSNTSQISLQEIGISTTKTLQKDLKLALGPLVRIEDETVYLIHTTLRGFIMSQRLSFPGSSSAEPPSGESSPAVLLAQKCSTYLSLPEIQKEEATIRMSTPSSNSDKHIEGNLFPHPTDASSGFLSYAVECWHLHLRRCKEESDEIRGLFSSFWEDQTTMKEWINLREAMPPSVRSATRPKPPPEALNSDFEFGACFGLANIVASLAKEDDFSDSNLGQGIQLALEAGHVDTVKALLPYVKSSDEWKKWLKSACRYGYLTLVDFILSAPDEARQAITQSELNDCLETATENGHWPIIASLLTAGADFDSTMKQKLLRLATARGYEGVVSTLLAAGATLKPSAEDGTITENTDSEDSFLYLAAEFGSAAVLKVVAPGADLDIKCGPWNAPAIHVTSEGMSLFLYKWREESFLTS